MNPLYHDLRSYRKKSCLSQTDVAHLYGTVDVSQVSRYETSPISPQVDIALLYHLLFNVPMTMFYEQRKEELRKKLIIRIPNFLNELRIFPPSHSIDEKIEYLENLLSILNTKKI